MKSRNHTATWCRGGILRVTAFFGRRPAQGTLARLAGFLKPPPRLRPAFEGLDDAGVPSKPNRVRGAVFRRSKGGGTGQNIFGHKRS